MRRASSTFIEGLRRQGQFSSVSSQMLTPPWKWRPTQKVFGPDCSSMSLTPLLKPLISAPITITTITPIATPRIVSAARTLLARSESSAMPTPSSRGVTRYSWRSATMGSSRAARLAGYTPATMPTPAPSSTPSTIETGDTEAGSGGAALRATESPIPVAPPSTAPIAASVADSARDFPRVAPRRAPGGRLHQQRVDAPGGVHLPLGGGDGGRDHELVERDAEQVAAPLGHADDAVGDAVDADRLAERVPPFEQLVREIVAHHEHGSAAARLLRGEGAALPDADVADVEVALRRPLQRDLLRLLAAVLHVPAVLGPPRRDHRDGDAVRPRIRVLEAEARRAPPRPPGRVRDVGGEVRPPAQVERVHADERPRELLGHVDVHPVDDRPGTDQKRDADEDADRREHALQLLGPDGLEGEPDGLGEVHSGRLAPVGGDEAVAQGHDPRGVRGDFLLGGAQYDRLALASQD